jgi:hypothetical protein
MRRHRLLTPDLSLDGERFAIKLYRHVRDPHFHKLLVVSFLSCSRLDSNQHCQSPQDCASCRWATRAWPDFLRPPIWGHQFLDWRMLGYPDELGWLVNYMLHPSKPRPSTKTTLRVNEPLRRGGCQSLTRDTLSDHTVVVNIFLKFL